MREKEILDKLDKVIELLEDIKRNTSPVITYPICPSVWEPYVPYEIQPNSGGWAQNDDWVYLPPLQKNNKVCHCDSCKGKNDAGGCCACGCRLVAIYTEDGNWWCNKCHQDSFFQDGSPKL